MDHEFIKTLTVAYLAQMAEHGVMSAVVLVSPDRSAAWTMSNFERPDVVAVLRFEADRLEQETSYREVIAVKIGDDHNVS
jgi:hypothetical protein